jgi:hypothetical protein
MAVIVHIKLINTPIEIANLEIWARNRQSSLIQAGKLAGKSQWMKF